MATKQPHFLLVPYSELGHINPMLSLASRLLSLGCLVTFVKADRDLPTANPDAASTPCEPLSAISEPSPASSHERLRFATLPVRNKALCVDPKTMTRHQIFRTTLAGLEDRQDLIAAIIEESKASSHPITCIICDSLLWNWVRHIARAHSLRSALLCIFSALTFYTTYLDAHGKDEDIEEVHVSQFGMPSKKDDAAYTGLLVLKDSLEMKLQKRKFFMSLVEGIEEASTIFINSLKSLEAPLLPSLEALGFDVRFIGPCILEWHNNDGMRNNMAQQAGNIFKEDATCLTWLDQQEKGSVLFVAFGSEGELELEQIKEVELGIKMSGYKFLWVARPNALVSSRSTHNFCEQINSQSKGIFVSWAPQMKVLQHFAVGGFLTHSGWSSTLESLTFGVPMLCLPILADQPSIANFVQNYLQVGIRLSVSKDGLVRKEDVASGVQAIMQGRFSKKVAQVKELAQLAIQEAHHNISSFVQAMV